MAAPMPTNRPPTVSMYDRAQIKFQSTNIDTILKVVRVTNVIMAMVLMAVFPLGFATQTIEVTPQRILLCVYAILFSLLLLAFETRVGERMKLMFKRMFGFMYSFTGRTAFLLFISSLALAAKAQWCTVVGICGIIVSTLNCMVVYNHPAFAQAGADNPDGKQDEVMAYLAQHPELVARAAAANNMTVAQQPQPEAKQYVPADGYVPPSTGDAPVAGGIPPDGDPFGDAPAGPAHVNVDVAAGDPFAAEGSAASGAMPANPLVAGDHDPFAEDAAGGGAGGAEQANNPFIDSVPPAAAPIADAQPGVPVPADDPFASDI